MIKIDKGIEIPPRRQGGGRPPKYPIREMEVGDSFFVPKSRKSAGGSVQAYANRILGKGATTVRNAIENGVEGFRIWRIK